MIFLYLFFCFILDFKFSGKLHSGYFFNDCGFLSDCKDFPIDGAIHSHYHEGKKNKNFEKDGIENLLKK